jgi:hypothetical protein
MQQSPLQLMYNTQFKVFKNLKTFGRMFVVTTKTTIQEKLNDRGTVGLFVVYPDNPANDVFNIKTNQIIKSRDLVWLNLSYGNINKSKNIIKSQDDEDISNTEATIEDASDSAKPKDATNDDIQIRKQNIALQQISKLKREKSWFNPDPLKSMEM